MGWVQKEQGPKRHGGGACLSQTMVRYGVTNVISQWMSCVTKKSRRRTMLVHAVRGIESRGDNRGSKKDALLPGPTRPRNALHFRRSGLGRPPKTGGYRGEDEGRSSPPPNRTRRQTKWDRTRRVVKPRERRSKKVENSVRSAHTNVLLLFDYGSSGRAGPLPRSHLHCVPVGPAVSNPRECSRSARRSDPTVYAGRRCCRASTETGWPCVHTRRGPLWEEELKAPRELDRWHKGTTSAFHRPLVLFRAGKEAPFHG